MSFSDTATMPTQTTTSLPENILRSDKIDLSTWILKREDESRFLKKPDNSVFKPKKLAHVYDKQGNIALRSMVVDLI